MSATETSSVSFGGCLTNEAVDEANCQVEKTGCPTGDFKTGLELENLDSDCEADDVITNRCTGGGLGLCTPSGCGTGSSSIADPNCNLVESDAADNTLTVYGACQEVFSNVITGCFYRPEDCLDADGDGEIDGSTARERYLDPDTLFGLLADPATSGVTLSGKLYCDCSDVNVGACVTDGLGTDSPTYYCAVHPDACDTAGDETFIGARQLMQTSANFTRPCRLCDDALIASWTRANTDTMLKNKQQEILAAKGGSGSGSTPSKSSNNSNDNGNQEAIIIVVIVVFSIIALLALICVGRRFCCGRKSTSETTAVDKDLELNEEEAAAADTQHDASESNSIPAEGKEIS